MRVEQRVGRIYRFGQTKVVQVYHFFNRGHDRREGSKLL